MKEFYDAVFSWSRVAPHQCMLVELRGQKVPVVYFQGQTKMIIPNNLNEPYIKGIDQSFILGAILESIRWNKIDITISNSISGDGQPIWTCNLSKDQKRASGSGKNMYLVLINCFYYIAADIGLGINDTDPVIQANFSIPSD